MNVELLRAALRRYSLQRLNRETGISTTTLQRIRDGESSPTLDMCNAIWNVLIEHAIVAENAERKANVGRPRKVQT